MHFGINPWNYLDSEEDKLMIWKAVIEEAQELELRHDRRLATLITNDIATLLGKMFGKK